MSVVSSFVCTNINNRTVKCLLFKTKVSSTGELKTTLGCWLQTGSVVNNMVCWWILCFVVLAELETIRLKKISDAVLPSLFSVLMKTLLLAFAPGVLYHCVGGRKEQ